MASIPGGAFLAPHHCHDALRKEMEIKRRERLSSSNSTTVSPDSTPPSSPRQYNPPSPYSPLTSLKRFLWPSSFQQPSQFPDRIPEVTHPGDRPTELGGSQPSKTTPQTNAKDFTKSV